MMKRRIRERFQIAFERFEPRHLLSTGSSPTDYLPLEVVSQPTEQYEADLIPPTVVNGSDEIQAAAVANLLADTAVTGLYLVNANSDNDIGLLTDGSVINLANLATSNLNVRAETSGTVGSVGFSLTGPSARNQTENVAPYALFGDASGNYNVGSFAVGQHTLVATPYSGGNKSGTAGTAMSISFEVIDESVGVPTTGVYNEENGLVIMEVENTSSTLGLWQQQTQYSNYTGDGYLQFTGNSTAGGPATSPLEYRFRINRSGLYYLHLRVARDTTHGQPGDHSNDAYVRVEGNYNAGPNAGNSHGDDAPLSMLQSNTKFFGGNANSFAWASGNRLDPGGENNKRVAIYDFEAGEEYLLVVSGRSKYFSADRIVFRHIGTSVGNAQDLNAQESLQSGVEVSGELKQWHKVTLTMDGPFASEGGTTNPFTDYRMNVTFTHAGTGLTYTTPGYFAADGDAANTGAFQGNKWRAHLAPDLDGVWNYEISFRSGTNVAVNASPTAGTAVSPFDGLSGNFTIGATDKVGRDFRGKGRLEYVGEHYLQFAGTGEYFLKQGTDAPENLLAYADFDGEFKSDGVSDNRIKTWSAHVADWNSGDPTWAGSKGKGLIGAVNYLASEELNAMSFLTMNIQGDDKNVFPYTTYTERTRMDVSRLDQWEIVFEHGDKQGIYLHFKTQETENDQLLDGGALGNQRKLYYRELIARYSHHLGLNWNLGEENTNTTQQRKDFAQFFYDNDPYRHNIVLHTFPGQKDSVYTPLLGSASKLTGLSLQTSQANFSQVHGDTAQWVNNSRNAGKKWVVAVDEPGDAQHSLRPDNDAGTSHTDARKNALWGTFMAGGAGNEWYFGYAHDHSDLTAEDFRSRDAFWDYARYAKSFFLDNDIPFWSMINDNAISTASNDYGFYKSGDVYTVYLKNGGTTSLNLGAASATETFNVRWFDPRNGGALQNGTVTQVSGGGTVSLGQAPNSVNQDWAILVTNTVASAQSPFGGTARDVADGSRIEAEDFDDGGEGVAYHDVVTNNQGTAYRPTESIGIQATTDAGGGYNVGWLANTEYFEYSVDINPGVYNIHLRVASNNVDPGDVRLLVGDGPEGTNFTELGVFEIGSTGGFQAWTTVSLSEIDLNPYAGDGKVLRLEMVGGNFNINWIEFNEVPTVTSVVINEGGVLSRPDLWSSLSVSFSSNVNVASGDLSLRNDTLGGASATIYLTSFNYDSSTFTATWNFDLDQALDAAFYTFLLDGNAITSVSGGLALDGDNNRSAGGNYSQSHYVAIPGDANLDGDVDASEPEGFDNVGDLFRVRPLVGTASGATWATGDFNGDGDIDGSQPVGFDNVGDLFVLLENLGKNVRPTASPAPVSLVATSTVLNSATPVELPVIPSSEIIEVTMAPTIALTVAPIIAPTQPVAVSEQPVALLETRTAVESKKGDLLDSASEPTELRQRSDVESVALAVVPLQKNPGVGRDAVPETRARKPHRIRKPAKTAVPIERLELVDGRAHIESHSKPSHDSSERSGKEVARRRAAKLVDEMFATLDIELDSLFAT
jgi:hypothetical protein